METEQRFTGVIDDLTSGEPSLEFWRLGKQAWLELAHCLYESDCLPNVHESIYTDWNFNTFCSKIFFDGCVKHNHHFA